MATDDDLKEEEIQALLDEPIDTSTAELEEYVLPAYIDEVWGNHGDVEDLIPAEHVTEKELGYTKPQFRADQETGIGEMAEIVDDTISDIAAESENAARMILQEEKNDLAKIGAGAGVLVGAPSYIMTFGSPAPGFSLLIEGGVFMSSAALIQHGARNIMETYSPGEIGKSLKYSASKSVNKHVMQPLGMTEMDPGELPSDATVVERKEELRDNVYLIDPDHRRIDAGELEEIVGAEPEYLRKLLEDDPELDADELPVDPDELYEDMVTVREDALDGKFYQLLIDITDTEAYADEVAEEAFITDQYSHIETLDDAIEAGRAYHIRDFHDQRGDDPDDATVGWEQVHLTPGDRQTVRDVYGELDAEERDLKVTGSVLETTDYDTVSLVVESDDFEDIPVTEYRSFVDELEDTFDHVDEDRVEEREDGVAAEYTAELGNSRFTITCVPDGATDGEQYVF
ncbi:MAG: hypothetical protein SV186_02990 [Candidatus Nanohaloarchaea archaeon]|nr:hypothetical protein [Candidatus Nanohaloarchaea archaeon]